MRIRFKQTVPSGSPGFPFQIGQTITVDKLTAEIRTWLKTGAAEIVPEPEPSEAAALAPPRPRGAR